MKKLYSGFAGNKHRIPALFIVAAVVLVVIAGTTFARYVLRSDNSGVAEAESFYFTSDLLREASEEKHYQIDPATTSFAITFSNAADSKRVTKEDIPVMVTVDGGTCEKETFTITGGTKGSERITITPDSNAEVITVTAVSAAPYQKTLTATFRLAPGNQYKVEDASGKRAAVLTITVVEAVSKAGVTVTLPEGIIPDAANTLVTKEADGSYKFQVEETGVYSLVLLKHNDAEDISAAETGFTDRIEIKEMTTP